MSKQKMAAEENLEKRYLNFYPSEGVDKKALEDINNILNVELPVDFCKIASFYSGGILGDISIYSFNRTDSPNIIDNTIILRETIELPDRFVVLAEPDESIIVMNTETKPQVLWIDAVEVKKLSNMSFDSKPEEWMNFSDFFEELLRQEEENSHNIP